VGNLAEFLQYLTYCKEWILCKSQQ
jgi:hypothetical protein